MSHDNRPAVVATPLSQRAYTAACPGCGAPVSFTSLASTHAVCGYCSSTIVRESDALKRIGKMAEVFDDYSSLQLMVQGKRGSVNFTVVGRLQYQYQSGSEGGSWNEWLLALDNGSTATLSEDNGSFVWSNALPANEAKAKLLPPASQWRVGTTSTINGKAFSVSSVQEVWLRAAQGELPKLPPLAQKFVMVELRSAQAEVLSIDYSTTPPSLALGKAVNLDDLQLTGLRDLSNTSGQGGKALQARQFNCPNCASTIELKLASSKSVSCPMCNSLIDLTQGIGGELQHALQDEPVQPLIPLGSLGTLQGKQWQVVGFQHRMGREPDDDESFGWQEYLLYNAKAGFVFLVDATDGWSLVKPTTGAPTVRTGTSCSYLGSTYQLQTTYDAQTSYVAGEFYWQVKRGQTSKNQDYANGASLLSREQVEGEISWSVGTKLDHKTVATAFNLRASETLFKRADITPVSSGSTRIWVWIVVILIVLFLIFSLRRCGRSCNPQIENCSSSAHSSGGSYGGYSSGGGHK